MRRSAFHMRSIFHAAQGHFTCPGANFIEKTKPQGLVFW
jgi:hypothetical protein